MKFVRGASESLLVARFLVVAYDTCVPVLCIKSVYETDNFGWRGPSRCWRIGAQVG